MNNFIFKNIFYLTSICTIVFIILACQEKTQEESGIVELGNRVLCVIIPQQTISNFVVQEVDIYRNIQSITADLRELTEKKIVILKPGDYIFTVDGYSTETFVIEEDMKITITNRGRPEEWIKVEKVRPEYIVLQYQNSDVNRPIEKRRYSLAVLNVGSPPIPLNQITAEVTSPTHKINQKYTFNKMEGNYAISAESYSFLMASDYTAIVSINGDTGRIPEKKFNVFDDDVTGPVLANSGKIFYYRTDGKPTILTLEFEDPNSIDKDYSFVTINGVNIRPRSNEYSNSNRRLRAEFDIPASMFSKNKEPVVIGYTVRDMDSDRGVSDRNVTTGNITLNEMEGIVQTFKITDRNNNPIPGADIKAFNNVTVPSSIMNTFVYGPFYNENVSSKKDSLENYTDKNGFITFLDFYIDDVITFIAIKDNVEYFAVNYRMREESSVPIPISFSQAPDKKPLEIKAEVESQYADVWKKAYDSGNKMTVSIEYEISHPEGDIARDVFLTRNIKPKITEDYYTINNTRIGIIFSFNEGEISSLANINYLVTVDFGGGIIFSMNNATSSSTPVIRLTRYSRGIE